MCSRVFNRSTWRIMLWRPIPGMKRKSALTCITGSPTKNQPPELIELLARSYKPGNRLPLPMIGWLGRGKLVTTCSFCFLHSQPYHAVFSSVVCHQEGNKSNVRCLHNVLPMKWMFNDFHVFSPCSVVYFNHKSHK